MAGEDAGREALDFIRALHPILDLVDYILEDSHAIGKRGELVGRGGSSLVRADESPREVPAACEHGVRSRFSEK